MGVDPSHLIPIEDNFWEIGGDSIKSVRLVRELKSAGFEHIKLRDMFDSPTIFQMVNRMGNVSGNDNILTLKSIPNAKAIFLMQQEQQVCTHR